MTRINTIDPRFLCDKHLAAEYRELPRVLNLAVKRLESLDPRFVMDNYPNVPDTYRLGTGHVTFFADKLGWLYRRHLQLIAELQYRSVCRNGVAKALTIDLTETYARLQNLAPHWCNDWIPDQEDHILLVHRLMRNMAEAKTLPTLGNRQLGTYQAVWEWVCEVCWHYNIRGNTKGQLLLSIRKYFPA